MYKISKYGWVKYFDYVIIDLMVVAIAFFAAYFLRHGFCDPFLLSEYKWLFLITLGFDFALFVIFDPLQGIMNRGYYRELTDTIKHALLLMAFLTSTAFFLKVGEDFSRLTVFWMLLIYIGLSYGCRLIWRYFKKKGQLFSNGPSLLIMTNTRLLDDLLSVIDAHHFGEYHLKGIILNDVNLVGMEINDIPVVAYEENAFEYIRKNWVDEVLISLEYGPDFPDELITECINMGITVHLNMAFNRKISGYKEISGNVLGNPVSSYSLNMMTPGQAFLKRMMDICGGLIGCIMTGFLWLFLAPVIKSKSPGPAFFKQTRIGMNGKPFTFYKFRSMYMDAEERKKELMSQNEMNGLMFKMAFDPRVIGNKIVDGKEKTGIGDFIRRHSLDEFPQFINVLRGDMSLVGTRPPTVDEFKLYEAHHRTRLSTIPGITGLWQISGRSEITDFEEIVKLDTEYINTWNFGRDIKIILQTIGMVFKPKGAV